MKLAYQIFEISILFIFELFSEIYAINALVFLLSRKYCSQSSPNLSMAKSMLD